MQKKIQISSISEIKQSTVFTANVLFDQNKPDSGSTENDLVDEPHTYRLELPEEPKIFDGTPGLEGELMITRNEDTDFSVDINGNLLVLHQYANKYTIDENGDLIYNY